MLCTQVATVYQQISIYSTKRKGRKYQQASMIIATKQPIDELIYSGWGQDGVH